MNKATVIADAGPLIAMGRISHFSLLASVLGKIIIPQAVADECLAEIAKPGAHEIQRAINRKDVEIYKNPAIHTYQKWLDLLGPGESAAIMLASQLKTGLLIDEKLGRHVARKVNIPLIGTAGVLLLAKQKKYIPEVAPLITALKIQGYYFSATLEKEILLRAHESCKAKIEAIIKEDEAYGKINTKTSLFE